MDELLLEAFRHHGWATKQVIAFCRDLTPEQLCSTTQGTYGSIFGTLNHIIYADAGYLPRAKVTRPVWVDEEADVEDLDELEARGEETARLWEAYLADPLDPHDLLLLDQGAYETESFVPIAQALHHGNVHREQICAILTALGLEPPDLQVWAYTEATGRARELRPA